MKKILIVEDEPFVRFLYKETLSAIYELEEVDNGFDALDLITANKYDLVIMDVNIPMMNGIDVLRKTREKKVDTRVIIVSAYGIKEKIDMAFSLGAVDYIVKPVDIDTLKAKIEKWC